MRDRNGRFSKSGEVTIEAEIRDATKAFERHFKQVAAKRRWRVHQYN